MVFVDADMCNSSPLFIESATAVARVRNGMGFPISATVLGHCVWRIAIHSYGDCNLLECFIILKYDIEAERWTKRTHRQGKGHRRTRVLGREELLEHLPALQQQLLYRLVSCQVLMSKPQYSMAINIEEKG